MTQRSPAVPGTDAWTITESTALLVRDWMRATGDSPLRPLWSAAYAGLRLAMTTALRFCSPGSTIYARGTFGEGRPLYGYSDLDLVAVTPNPEAAAKAQGCVERALQTLPVASRAVDVAVMTRADLVAASAIPFVCLAEPAGDRLDRGPAGGLGVSFFGRVRPWRKLSGPGIGRLGRVDSAHRLQWAWLEAQFRWKHMLRALLGDGERLQAAHVASNSLVGLLQVRRWAESGEEPTDAESAAADAVDRAPELSGVIESALRHRDGDRAPSPEEVLPAVAVLTHALAQLAAEAVGRTTAVDLIGAPPAGERQILPLLDWRSMAFPTDANETFAPTLGSIADLALLQSSATSDGKHRPAILDGRVLLTPILPGSPADSAAAQDWVMRSALCAVSDPVCWALARGDSTAHFPDLAGWSLTDWSLRSVAELTALLDPRRFDAAPKSKRVARLMASSRVVALLESLEAGRPAVRVSLDSVADWVERRYPKLNRAVSDAEPFPLDAWRLAMAAELARVRTQAAPLKDSG